MTEVASLLPADHRLTTVRRYEAGPPEGLELVEPEETFATTKEEEWVSKKKTEVINTKQIETRVKRQVVLEDGEVVEDSGPVVTTNTTEDTKTQEHHQTELRKLGDDQPDGPPNALETSPETVAVPNPEGVVREVKEKRVISREETEEVKETEDVQHFGDITDEDFLSAVKTGKKDLRDVLRSTKNGVSVVSTGPRVVHESSKSNKVTDTEDTRELSSVLPDGKIVTETQRTTEHEEIKDDELPEDAPEQDFYKESSQKYLKTREQEDVDYLADGVKIGHEMRFRTETMEVERHGDDDDEPDFDSLSARARRRVNNRQPHRYRGLENGVSPLDRKDALTRKPLDFDQEEETRKVETSKWLEHHFGSESRSSNSVIDDEEQPPKTSFFNVTIKSQPSRADPPPQKYITTINNSPRVYSPVEPERDRPTHHSEYYKGISQWSERHPLPSYHHQDTPIYVHEPVTYTPPRRSPIPDYRTSSPMLVSPPPVRISPIREITPTPPQRKRVSERRHHDSRYANAAAMEPPPDYSPPVNEKKAMQKTRFAPDPPKAKSGNIIGQSIRKLVGKIRSASTERKTRHRTKRSPSPSYQKGHVIDNNIHHNGMENKQPVQRYYLGEDPFGGSIYGRENKYDGVKPARSSSKRKEEEHRSQSTLGRFSKSTSRLMSTTAPHERNSQTLPRHLSRHHDPPTRLEKNNKSNSTINVSIINTVSRTLGPPLGPAKPARTYKSNLSRSKSLNVHANDYRKPGMYTSNPHLNRLEETPAGLKSPGLISSLSRSQKDLQEDSVYTNRFARNGTSDSTSDNKRVFMKSLKDRAPELFKTLHEDEPDSVIYSTPIKSHHKNKYNGDIYEPPTRLREPQSILRRGSNSSTDYSETYHTTTRNDDPLRPSVTNTVKSYSKKTIPAKNGRSLETIESSETKSITKSHFRGDPSVKFYETERRYSGGSPVVIEVRNSNFRK
ncbi:uncharacterized protein LOC123004400 isoform X2 [Tribolium madens]|uniref:uncharacterized protein LOC123004400 isoform X2 n=1 Tax=Tribolium madens TaxID=41895 RepID=UPI001CF72DF6|nr:uncharacterized protein LOC123004400 isoform X2 [Tribolium madens]